MTTMTTNPTNTHKALAAPVVVAYTLNCDQFNEWVLEVEGIRRGRWMGPDATYAAARAANEWRRQLGLTATD